MSSSLDARFVVRPIRLPISDEASGRISVAYPRLVNITSERQAKPAQVPNDTAMNDTFTDAKGPYRGVRHLSM